MIENEATQFDTGVEQSHNDPIGFARGMRNLSRFLAGPCRARDESPERAERVERYARIIARGERIFEAGSDRPTKKRRKKK